MRKPCWVSVCGFIALGCGIANILLLALPAAAEPVQLTILVFALAGVGFGTFALWLIGTVTHRLMAHNARVKADAMATALRTHYRT